MEFLRKLFVQTQNHLKGLTLSQRMAIGSCVALIAVSLLWLVNWAGTTEMVPLLDQPLTAQELTPIEQRLDALGVTYKTAGDTILVPAGNQRRLMAQLSQGKALPKNISLNFEKLVADSSPFLSMEEQGWRRGVALGNELALVLREFEGVTDARVFIDKNFRRTIGQTPVAPKASVFVKLAPGTTLDRERVFAMASIVSSAVSGLEISNVAVTDATTSRSFTVPKVEDGMAFDDLEDRQKKEEYFANKIKSLLANIPGLLVAVHAELDPESRKTEQQKFGKPVQLMEKTETSIQDRGSPASGNGVVPNTSKSVPAAGVTDKMEKNNSEATYDGKVDATLTRTESPRHGIKSLSAAVNVPRSYLAAIFKGGNSGKEPTDADLQTSGDPELQKIQDSVLSALGLTVTEKGKVTVKWFHDDAIVQMSAGGGANVIEAGSSAGVMALVRTYGGKAGLGALAAVSFLMMLMMVRKVGEGPILPGEERPKQQVIFLRDKRAAKQAEMQVSMNVVTPPVGEAESSEQLLVGKEIDDRTLHTQQVVQQVADMIKEDPDTSVGILQRWIDADK